MKLLQPLFVLVWFLIALTQPLLAAVPTPASPHLAAEGYLLIDFESGHILAESNADKQLEPASLTKIMTAYTVFRELREGNVTLEDQVLISEKAWRTEGSRMFIEVNKQVSLELLIKGMVIQSGNDASVAIAEYIAGSEDAFANLMNTHAQRLGMTATHYINATGLPHPEHFTTARDLAMVVKATIKEFPDYYAWYREKEMTYNKIKQSNRNKLLWRDKSVDGMKTGHTEAAGYCLVASAKRENMRLISVVLGTTSKKARARESQTLLNYGFRFFETRKVHQAGASLQTARVWKGALAEISLGISETLVLTIPRRKGVNLLSEYTITPQITAPVAKGTQLGSMTVSLNGKVLAKAPLVALTSVAEGSVWQQTKDAALLLLE